MIGSFLIRALVMILGYAYPAYECYKCVEQNKPDIQELLFWCKYWILISVLTVGERVGDAFISWIPMYSEAKIAFIVYLWFPKTRGTAYVYSSFFRPYLAKHETEIDRNLMEIKTRVGDVVAMSFQRAATYSQTRIYDILQYVAAQSVTTPRPGPPQQGGSRVRRPTPPVNANPRPEEPLSPTSSSSSSQDPQNQEEVDEGYVVLTKSAPLAPQKDKISASAAGTSSLQVAASGKEATDSASASASSLSEPQDSNPPTTTIVEDMLRVTRARARRNPSTVDGK